MAKCEHGLTSAVCLVCASPKYWKNNVPCCAGSGQVCKDLADARGIAQACELRAERAEQAMDRIHHALNDAGWHPGRTDDLLTDIIAAKAKEAAKLKTEYKKLQALVTSQGIRLMEAEDAEQEAAAIDEPLPPSPSNG